MSIEKKLAELGLTLPPPWPFPSQNRTGCVLSGIHLFVSGHVPSNDSVRGKVGTNVGEEIAYALARDAALSILSSVKDRLGSLDRVTRVVKIFGMVNCAETFDRHFAVVDGASDLFLELWGPDHGRHARSAVGMCSLPRGAPVEIEAVFEVLE